MKRIYIVLLFVNITMPILNSQWLQQTIPNSGQILDMVFLNKDTGYVADNNYKLHRTTNGGNNWIAAFNFRFRKLESADSHSIYGLLWNSSKLYRSYDAGFTWDSISIAGTSFYNVSFINKDTGWISTNTGICKTTNGGLNIQLVSNQFPATYENVKIKMIKHQVGANFYGYIFTSGPIMNGIYVTTNSGNNWIQSLNVGGVMEMTILNKDTAWASATNPLSNSRIYRTTDNGSNWTIQYLNNQYFTSKIFFIDRFNGWCGISDTSFTYAILATTNGGENWGFQALPINYSEVIHFVNSSTGWVMSLSQIAKTTNGGGNISYSSLVPVGNEIPESYFLSQNYPNPFNPVTNIEFFLPKQSFVKLIIYNLLGSEIETLVSEELSPGRYNSSWDAAKYSSGVYYYKLITDNYTETKKMVLIK